ncbi:MAG: hypothetical protein LBD88_05320 [Candidatus Peribacteria bacterium]|jgi:hypothetical protein|nr:hypothetical protein [Candidatus Peribacteria bacterium]
MAYIEDAFDYITLDETSITNSKDLPAKVPASGYDLLFDGFSLEPNESITIKYS